MPIEGESVRLREERREDIPFLTALRNDLESQAWTKTLPPDFTEPMILRRFESREFSYDPTEARFVIESVESDEPVGYIAYSNLHRRMAATVGISLAATAWGKGFGEEATELLLHFLFVELGVRVVRLSTNTGNPRAIALAEKLGFKMAIRQRESVFRAGELFDNVMMDMVRDEYFEGHPGLVDGLPGL